MSATDSQRRSSADDTPLAAASDVPARGGAAWAGAAFRVGGLARLSSVDWPGELVATVFSAGCPWDCAYCHNPHLLSRAEPGQGEREMSWREVVAFLESRVGLLDGVVFSGGEPLVQQALPSVIAEVRELGFRVALHTNGVAPGRLAEVLPLLDWVGFDAKAPRASYERVTRVAGSAALAWESLALLAGSGVDFEVRTTVHPDLLGDDELLQLAEELRDLSVARWVLQPCRMDGVRPGLLAPARPDLSERLLSRLAEGFSAFEVRE